MFGFAIGTAEDWIAALDERINLYVEEEWARREDCAHLIVACFGSAKEQLGELDAWAMFVQFAKAALPDPVIVARDKDFEEQLLAAHDAAGDGAREQAAMEAGRRCRKPTEIALRRLARILCRRVAAASSREELRLAFGLDPLEKIKQAHDQFAQLSQAPKPEVRGPSAEGFSDLLSSDTIDIPSQPNFAEASGSSAEAVPSSPSQPSSTEEQTAAEADKEGQTAQVIELRRSRNGAGPGGSSSPRRRRRDSLR